MNIAIISMYLPSGSPIGVGYVVHYLANELVQRGHRVTVFSQSGHSEGALYETTVVPSGRRLRTFGFAWNLRKVGFSAFDVLHACGDDWFLWGTKRPRHIHTYMGSCRAEMRNATATGARLRMAALALCEYSSTFLADELVAISENTCRDIPRVRRVIPCGVDTRVFRPEGEKAGPPSLLFVGMLDSRKRGRLLLDIFQRDIRPRVPNAELWIVRDTQKVDAEGVRCFGRVSTEELAALYRRAWVFCLPSTYEGFGVPYVEAMASGTAVVASPNVGALEVCANGKSGLIVQDEELPQALLRLLTDEDERQRYERAGLERARDFGWERICEQYEALYRGEAAT